MNPEEVDDLLAEIEGNHIGNELLVQHLRDGTTQALCNLCEEPQPCMVTRLYEAFKAEREHADALNERLVAVSENHHGVFHRDTGADFAACQEVPCLTTKRLLAAHRARRGGKKG